MRTGSVSQCCRDGETTKCPFSMTLKNYCDQRTLGQQEQQGTDLKGSFQRYCAAFPQTHKPDSSCLLQRPQLLSSPFATVCTNWSPEYSHYSKTIWALREQNLRHHICTSKTSQPQHLQEQEREQTEQRWQWRRQLFFFFLHRGSSPSRFVSDYLQNWEPAVLSFHNSCSAPTWLHQPSPSPCKPS